MMMRTSNASKTTARERVGEGVKSGNGKSDDNAAKNTRSRKQSDNRETVGEGVKSGNGKSDVNAAKNTRSRKQSDNRETVGEGVKSGNGKSDDNSANNERSRKQSDNRDTVGEGVKSGNGKSDDNSANNERSQKRSYAARRTATKDDRKKSDDRVPAIAADKNRKPATTGAQLKGVGGSSGTQRKTGPSADVGGADDDKNRKLYNSNRNIPGADGVAEKSKTAWTRNTGSVGKKPKNPNTKMNGVGKEERDETMISETLISPAIDYHDNASPTAARYGIKKPVGTKGISSAAEAIDSPRAPADVRGDDSGGGVGGVGGGGGGGGVGGGGVVGGVGGVGGGGKKAVPSEKLISPAIDYHDDASLTAARDGINEPVSTKGSPRAPADVRGDDSGGGGVGGGGGGVGSGGKDAINLGDNGKDRMLNERDRTGPGNSETAGRARIGHQNQDETGCTTTTPTAADKAGGGRRTDNSCTDDDIYKLRKACALGQSDQCQNKDTGLYQAKRKGSKFEVIDLTQEEYCKLNK
ncbi:uncharacterized protein LOC111039114 [Myzus persicae]|uniref:uncharacterized protein LOC111039114 n=1 Tax=Myzus persicae TaxID=13164 RepID=UPI000B933B0D|nr:uncharacterized protein LOC111039114 [Myzus persicae]